MVGMIVTGHGSFAAGITSGLKLLAGEPELYEAVDFPPEDSIGSLTEKLAAAVDRLAGCRGVLVLADLAGGSPFNVALRMKLIRSEGLEVVGGANLPAVLQAYMSRGMIEDVEALAEEALNAGREQMVRYRYLPAEAEEEAYEE